MNKLFYFSILIIAGFIFSDEGIAGRIIMAHETKVSMDDQWVDVHLTIKNEGDEDSLMVYPTLKLENQTVDLKKVPYIAFGGAQQWHYRFSKESLGIRRPGRYPLYLLIHYHDSQMYPFSSPDITFIDFGHMQSDCAISGEFAAAQNDGKTDITFSLTNQCSYPVSGKCKVFLPKEFQAQLSEKPFLLAQNSSQSIIFTIENQGALKGSRYRVYGVAEYLIADQHFTFAFPGMISITESNPAKNNDYKIIGCIVFLCILFFFTLYVELGKVGWKLNQ